MNLLRASHFNWKEGSLVGRIAGGDNNQMANKKWQDVQPSALDGPEIAPEVYSAIKQLHEWEATFAADFSDTTTTTSVADSLLEKAIWTDVGKAIAKAGGPKIPAKIKFGKPGKKVSVELRLGTLIGFLKMADVAGKDQSMVAKLAKCVAVRSKVIRERLLWRPEDWWLRLTLNNVTKHVVKYLKDAESDNA